MNSTLKAGFKYFACFLIYYLLGKLGISLAKLNGTSSPVWPASGYAVACLFLAGPRMALSIFLGAFLINFETGLPLAPTLGIALGNTLEALIGIAIIKKFSKLYPSKRLVHPLGFVVAAFIAALVASTIGNICLVYFGIIPLKFSDHSWITWWIGDSIGILLLSPLIIYQANKSYSQWITDFKTFKNQLILVGGVLVTILVFTKILPPGFFILHNLIIYLIVLTIGFNLSATYTLLVSATSILLIIKGYQPFQIAALNDQLIEIQTLLGLLGITNLFAVPHREGKLSRTSFSFMSLSWLACAICFQYLLFANQRDQRHELDTFKTEIIKDLRKTELSIETAMDGGAALYAATQDVTAKEWHAFVNKLNLPTRYPGILGLGVVDRLTYQELPNYLRSVQKIDNKSLQPHPALPQKMPPQQEDAVYILRYMEPHDLSQNAPGLIVSSDPLRKAAADISTTKDQTISTKITNSLETEKQMDAGVIFRPVYKKGTNTQTSMQKELAVEKWIYAPFTFQTLLGTALNKFQESVLIKITFKGAKNELFVLGRKSNEDLTTKNFIADEFTVNFLNHPIQVNITKLESVNQGSQTHISLFMFLIGISILLVYKIISILESFKTEAEKLIELRTGQYKDEIEKNKNIFESAKFSIITTDASGVITAFNKEAENILGYSSEEVISRMTPAAFHLHDEVATVAKELSQEYQEIVPIGFDTFVFKAKKGSFDDRQWTYVSKNGQKVQIQLSVTALRDQFGNIVGYMGIGKNLTQEIELQKTIENQKLSLLASSKMASLGEVAAGIAHEINNPLSIIAGWIEVIQLSIKDRPETPTSQIVEPLSRIKGAAVRAAEIIKSLKSLSRHTDGDPLTAVHLSNAAKESVDLFKQRFILNDISIELEISEEIEILGRYSQVMQIITNLLSNSFDAIQKLPEKWIKISAEQEGTLVKIKLIDSGNGIEKSIQDKLMQPFFTTKEVGKGTGLGLSISHQIAREFGGRLYIDSTCKNTCFVLEVKRAEIIAKVA